MTERANGGSERLQCQLRYLVKGVYTTRDSQQALAQELDELLPKADAITVLPVVQGYSVDLEIMDIAPFNRVSFEPYIADHVLADAVRIHCESDDEIQISEKTGFGDILSKMLHFVEIGSESRSTH